MPLHKPAAEIKEYNHPAGGRGAVAGSFAAFKNHRIPISVISSFANANKPGGFDCPGCAFPDKADGMGPDSCEQGQKAIAHEMTNKRADAAFFVAHSLASLRRWTDKELEDAGRLTEPLLYDPALDIYRAVDWPTAFAMIESTMRAIEPRDAAFYASGRSSNEAAFLWQLAARAYGSANLPDSSNLCHEPSGYAMKEQIGMGKGTCHLSDFEHAELIVVIGQNPATNHPRMMGCLHEAEERGATVIAVNPLKERGFTNFSDPKNVKEMLLDKGRQVAKAVHQVRIGGDMALIKGVMKRLIEIEDGGRPVIDHAFVDEHCDHYEALAADLRSESWELIVGKSGIPKADVEEIAELYAQSDATMITWCMGITHHEDSVATIQAIMNLLLMRGNIGKPGAGAMPVRGHSNVQGDRTQGCTFKVPGLWLDNMEKAFPGQFICREVGQDAIAVLERLAKNDLRAFLSLGGNFATASPDSWATYGGLMACEITVHIATKFNRTHCYPGKAGLILPCFGRTDKDFRAGAEQFVTVEDSMSMVHSSMGIKKPISPLMMSEPAICAGLGLALSGGAAIDWISMSNDYGLIREKIEACQKGVFHGFDGYNEKIKQKGGFWLTNWAAQRVWKNPEGRAQFKIHPIRVDGPIERAIERDGAKVLALMTIRSHDQFNTTIYGLDDRYRGVFGGRHVIFLNKDDIAAQGFEDGQFVDIRTCSEDGRARSVKGFRIVAYDIPRGCAASYLPEATPLHPIGLHSRKTRTPASKEVPVLISPAEHPFAGGGQLDPFSAADA